MKKPLKKYIRRPAKTESLQLRIDAKLKHEIDLCATKLNTSMNRFAEAAVTFYMEALKKDGAL